MNIHLNKPLLVTCGIPLLIIATSVFLAISPYLSKYPDLVMGITYDLTLTAPLVYFLLIRKKEIPKITVVPVFLLGVILAGLLLPENKKCHLHLVTTYLLPVIEFGVLSISSYNIYKTVKAFKESSLKSQDFYFVIKESCIRAYDYSIFAKVVAYEIASSYYAFFSWKKNPKPEDGFTHYKDTGITALLLVLILLLLVETFVVHLLVTRWSETVAWILSVSGLYVVIQILGHLKAMRRRFSELQDDHLYLKYGLFGDIKVEYAKISTVKICSNNIDNKSIRVEKLALLADLEPHNVVIYFTQKQKVEKAYGLVKECDVLLVQIDNNEMFIKRVNERLEKISC